MSTVIDSLERAQLRRVPRFAAGDRLRVHFQVTEGTRRRTQVFEGIVIKRQGHGLRETFTVRKQSFGVGVERTFPVHSPKIERIEVAARGDVRRAKLYYLRERVGKRARVRERRGVVGLEEIFEPEPTSSDMPPARRTRPPLGRQAPLKPMKRPRRRARTPPSRTRPPRLRPARSSPSPSPRPRPRPTLKQQKSRRLRRGQSTESRQKPSAGGGGGAERPGGGGDRRGRAGVTSRRRSVGGSLVELVVIVAAALGLALLVQAFVVKPYRIPSGSMEPTLKIGQRILVNRLAARFSSPGVGEIVVFHPPSQYQQGCS